jgi:hypothetical protein
MDTSRFNRYSNSHHVGAPLVALMWAASSCDDACRPRQAGAGTLTSSRLVEGSVLF